MSRIAMTSGLLAAGGGGGGGDPFFSDVVSLLPLDVDLTDVKGKTWVPTGTATIVPSPVRFGAGSLELTSIGANRIDATSSDFNFGTGDFTIEGFFNAQSVSNRAFFSFGARLVYTASGWAYFNGSTNAISGGTVLTGSFQHVALCRASGVMRLFVDGVQVGSDFAESVAIDPGAMRIGWYNGGNPAGTFYDEFRVTKGVARYTSNFTPPSSAFPRS